MTRQLHAWDIQAGDTLTLAGTQVTVTAKHWDARHPGSVDVTVTDPDGRARTLPLDLAPTYTVTRPGDPR